MGPQAADYLSANAVEITQNMGIKGITKLKNFMPLPMR